MADSCRTDLKKKREQKKILFSQTLYFTDKNLFFIG